MNQRTWLTICDARTIPIREGSSLLMPSTGIHTTAEDVTRNILVSIGLSEEADIDIMPIDLYHLPCFSKQG